MPQHLYTDESESTLLLQLKNGDERAFTLIFERYNRMLYVLAYKYLKDTFLAEDIVQQVFLKFWEARFFLTENIHLRNYLYTMTKNMVLNEIRNNTTAMEKNYEIVQNSPEFEDKLVSSLEEKDLKQLFEKVMSELPEQKRKVCRLKIFTDLSNQEIADELHISVPTVKTHYSIGIKYIRTRMQRFLLLLLLFIINY